MPRKHRLPLSNWVYCQRPRLPSRLSMAYPMLIQCLLPRHNQVNTPSQGSGWMLWINASHRPPSISTSSWCWWASPPASSLWTSWWQIGFFSWKKPCLFKFLPPKSVTGRPLAWLLNLGGSASQHRETSLFFLSLSDNHLDFKVWLMAPRMWILWSCDPLELLPLPIFFTNPTWDGWKKPWFLTIPTTHSI